MDKLNPPKKFSISGRLKSFQYAFNGLLYLMKSQHNAWIHAAASIIVIFGGFYFSVSKTEWIFLIFAIAMVFSAETFNTAIELLVDKISPEYNRVAGKIKDLAAGAVLLSAIGAAIAGIIIFTPKIFGLIFN